MKKLIERLQIEVEKGRLPLWLEMERRDSDYLAGKTKGYSWEEVKKEARLRNGA